MRFSGLDDVLVNMDRTERAQTESGSELPEDATAGALSRSEGPWTRTVRWVLLKGDRMVVAGLLLVAILVAYTALELVGFTAAQNLGVVSSALSALVSGNLTVITVVLSINQLVLSRELQGIGGLTSSTEEVSEFRERVREDLGREVTPETPAEFLSLLLRTTRAEVEQLEDSTAHVDDDDFRADVDEFANRLTAHTDRVVGLLRKPDIGVFGVLAATLSTNYAYELNETRRIKARYRDQLPDMAVTSLDNIARRVKDIDVARQYFKTMYMQEELSYFSRLLLYVGIPAEFLTVATLIAVSKSGGALAGLPATLPVVAPIVITVAFAPLVVLFSFMVRVATVAHNTISAAQFTTPGTGSTRRS